MIPEPISSWSKNFFQCWIKLMVMDAAAANKTKYDE
jgi:hypothetical protein